MNFLHIFLKHPAIVNFLALFNALRDVTLDPEQAEMNDLLPLALIGNIEAREEIERLLLASQRKGNRDAHEMLHDAYLDSEGDLRTFLTLLENNCRKWEADLRATYGVDIPSEDTSPRQSPAAQAITLSTPARDVMVSAATEIPAPSPRKSTDVAAAGAAVTAGLDGVTRASAEALAARMTREARGRGTAASLTQEQHNQPQVTPTPK